MLPLLALAASIVASFQQGDQPRFCSNGWRASQFLAQVRAIASLNDPDGLREGQGIPLFTADQARLVVNDSVCAAVSRVLGKYINSGAFPRQKRKAPFPLTVVQAGSKYFVRDIRSPGLLDHGESFVTVDTFLPRPAAPYVLPGFARFACSHLGRLLLLTPVTLRGTPSPSAPSIGQLPAKITVQADSDVALVDSVGLIVVRAPVWDYNLNDSLGVGDTLVTLLEIRSNGNSVPDYVAWFRGLITRPSTGGTMGQPGAEIVAHPRWTSWVRMTDTAAGNRLHGWVAMTDSVQVIGDEDSCE